MDRLPPSMETPLMRRAGIAAYRTARARWGGAVRVLATVPRPLRLPIISGNRRQQDLGYRSPALFGQHAQAPAVLLDRECYHVVE